MQFPRVKCRAIATRERKRERENPQRGCNARFRFYARERGRDTRYPA